MANYHLAQSPKTKLLNLFRKVFTVPLFEKFLVAKTVNGSSAFFKKLIPPDYLYKPNSFRYATRGGIHYKLDVSNVVDHYLYYGNKDATYQEVLDTIKQAGVILDIGANIGSTALFFASINPTATIIGFEPHPNTYLKAKENLSLNDAKNITLLNKGLGETKTVLKLYEVNTNNPGMNRIMAGTEENNNPFKEIEIDTLDDVMQQNNITKVDYIKLDVEGYEYAVLAGGIKTLQSKPVMFIELDDDNLRENNKSAKELISLITSCGYSSIYRADNLAPITVDTDFSNCHFDIIAR